MRETPSEDPGFCTNKRDRAVKNDLQQPTTLRVALSKVKHLKPCYVFVLFALLPAQVSLVRKISQRQRHHRDGNARPWDVTIKTHLT